MFVAGTLNLLQELNLGGNKIQRLPASLGQLSLLQILILERNQLESLPDSICDLSGTMQFLSHQKTVQEIAKQF